KRGASEYLSGIDVFQETLSPSFESLQLFANLRRQNFAVRQAKHSLLHEGLKQRPLQAKACIESDPPHVVGQRFQFRERCLRKYLCCPHIVENARGYHEE